jgi:4Fe-4S single cluster domain
MKNTFCKWLSNGYTFKINPKTKGLEVKPCCWFTKSIPFDENHLVRREQEFNSITEWTDACKVCHQIEKNSGKSMRTSTSYFVDDNEDSLDPIMIDVNLDYSCNAACATCSEELSTLWRKENQKLNGIAFQNTNKTEDLSEKIKTITDLTKLDRVKFIKIWGGEPLFTDTHLKFIREISNPAQVILNYNTNGSIFPSEEILKIWKQFKRVDLSVSIDGIEEQFEYIRWPLKWDRVSENFLRLSRLDLPNITVQIEYTVNFLNSFYFDRLENWVVTNIKNSPETIIKIHPCFGKEWHLSNMPIELRQKMLEKYPKPHRLYNMINNLPEPTSLIAWEQFTKLWDYRRNNSWQQAFPDLVQYF